MKVCPACNEEFPDDKDYCDFCGIKLDAVEGSEEEMEDMEKAEEEPMEEETEGEMMECPICGTMNEVDAKFCKNCAANLEEAEAEESVEAEEEEALELDEPIEEGEKGLTLILPGDEEIEVSDEGVVLGREDFEGILSDEDLRYLSRRNNPNEPDKRQFEIFKEDGEYYVLDEKSTNNTYLEGEKIKGEGKKVLSDGDKIEPAGEITIEVRIE